MHITCMYCQSRRCAVVPGVLGNELPPFQLEWARHHNIYCVRGIYRIRVQMTKHISTFRFTSSEIRGRLELALSCTWTFQSGACVELKSWPTFSGQSSKVNTYFYIRQFRDQQNWSVSRNISRFIFQVPGPLFSPVLFRFS